MPRIIPIFIMNRGCHNRCIFCNEKIAAGELQSPFSADLIRQAIMDGLKRNNGCKPSIKREGLDTVQIAFYGGNFTGLPMDEQMALLRVVEPFIDEGIVDSVRISTRPDDVFPEQMDMLRKQHVRTVEVGAQSLVDEVLLASGRGHTVADVSTSVSILKGEGFETGIHLMVGLPGDSPERFAATVDAAVAMAPDMVRVHPTLVFRDTLLAEAYERGEYKPLTMAEALTACKYAVKCFTGAHIPVIRLGLQSTPEMEKPGAVVAGPFHPAFGALVESSSFLDKASAMLQERDVQDHWVTFHVPPRRESAFRGERNGNLRILVERFLLAGIKIKRDEVFRMSLS